VKKTNRASSSRKGGRTPGSARRWSISFNGTRSMISMRRAARDPGRRAHALQQFLERAAKASPEKVVAAARKVCTSMAD